MGKLLIHYRAIVAGHRSCDPFTWLRFTAGYRAPTDVARIYTGQSAGRKVCDGWWGFLPRKEVSP